MHSQIESLLFISSRPLSCKQLSEILKIDQEKILEMMNEIMGKYNTPQSGIHILRHEGQKNGLISFQMTTNSSNAEVVQDFVKEELSGELTRPSLETLTIIAYRGPVSKTEIEQIRGVNCSLILKNLLLRGLVEVKEDKEQMASFYNITPDFMRYLGINDVKNLPDYARLSSSEIINDILLESGNV